MKGFTLILITLFGLVSNIAYGQELEPRALTNVPVGTNFAIVGYGYSWGNLLLDPSIPIEGLNGNVHTIITSYVRSVDFFGLSGKVDIVVPIAMGDWEGTVSGIYTTTSTYGIGDIRLRFSFNFLGSPALSKSEFEDYRPENISGFSLQVIAPTGKYDPEEFINTGSNRWVFRPQWGFSHSFNKWIIESYISMWIFTKNPDYYGGNVLTQQNLYAVKFHVIRSLPKNMWLAINIGYAIGGRTSLNGIEMDTRISTFRFGLNYALSLNIHHSLKFTFVSGIRLEKGGDFEALVLSYQYRWGGK